MATRETRALRAPCVAGLCITAVAAAAVALLCAGCDGNGLFGDTTDVTAGDQTPSGGGGGGGGGTTPTPDTRFLGTWVTSFGDDLVTSSARNGRNEYAISLALRQNDAQMTGTGTMLRMFAEGQTATDEVGLTVSGTASGDDATLHIQSTSTGKFDFPPLWYMRLAGDRLVGMYVAMDSNGLAARSGHTLWLRASTATLDGSYVAGFKDSFAVSGIGAKDRTAALSLAQTPESAIDGAGTLVEQREGDDPLEMSFNVTRGGVSGARLGFTFGGLDLDQNPIDWFAYFEGNTIVGVYGQYNSANELTRNGHARWYRALDIGPSAVSHTWTTAFADSAVATGLAPSDYLAVVKLQAQTGGAVTGSGQVLDPGESNPALRTYSVENGNIVGSQVRFLLRGPAGIFSWVLRVAGDVMVGSYERTAADGQFLGRGIAEWRYGGSTVMTGTWAASFYDTFGAGSAESTQFALVTISSQDTDGNLSGIGTLRYAGEPSRRLFTVSGSLVGPDIQWVWRGSDLFGDTFWYLRQAGDLLNSAYMNQDSSGNLEFRGNALWVRSSTSSQL